MNDKFDNRMRGEANRKWVADKIAEKGMTREVRVAAVKRLNAEVIRAVFNDIMTTEFPGGLDA